VNKLQKQRRHTTASIANCNRPKFRRKFVKAALVERSAARPDILARNTRKEYPLCLLVDVIIQTPFAVLQGSTIASSVPRNCIVVF